MVLLAHSPALEIQEAGKHFMVNEREGEELESMAAAESDASTDPRGKSTKSGMPRRSITTRYSLIFIFRVLDPSFLDWIDHYRRYVRCQKLSRPNKPQQKQIHKTFRMERKVLEDLRNQTKRIPLVVSPPFFFFAFQDAYDDGGASRI